MPCYDHSQPGLSDIESGTRLSNVDGFEGQQCNKSNKANFTWHKLSNSEV